MKDAKTRQLSVTIPADLIDRLDKVCEQRALGRTWVVTHALEPFLTRLEGEWLNELGKAESPGV